MEKLVNCKSCKIEFKFGNSYGNGYCSKCWDTKNPCIKCGSKFHDYDELKTSMCRKCEKKVCTGSTYNGNLCEDCYFGKLVNCKKCSIQLNFGSTYLDGLCEDCHFGKLVNCKSCKIKFKFGNSYGNGYCSKCWDTKNPCIKCGSKFHDYDELKTSMCRKCEKKVCTGSTYNGNLCEDCHLGKIINCKSCKIEFKFGNSYGDDCCSKCWDTKNPCIKCGSKFHDYDELKTSMCRKCEKKVCAGSTYNGNLCEDCHFGKLVNCKKCSIQLNFGSTYLGGLCENCHFGKIPQLDFTQQLYLNDYSIDNIETKDTCTKCNCKIISGGINYAPKNNEKICGSCFFLGKNIKLCRCGKYVTDSDLKMYRYLNLTSDLCSECFNIEKISICSCGKDIIGDNIMFCSLTKIKSCCATCIERQVYSNN